MTTLDKPTPLQRLAHTRAAIERQMAAGKPVSSSARSDGAPVRAAPAVAPLATTMLWQAAQSWWRRQPASVAVDLAYPILGIYARKHPLWVVAAAAGMGAATALIRPWRLLTGKRLVWLAASSAGLPALLQSLPHQRKPSTAQKTR